MSTPKKEQGFALLIVLWAVVLLTILGMQLVTAGRTDLQLAGNLREAAIAEAAADGAVYQTLFHLLATQDQHWAPSGTHQIMVGDINVTVAIANLSGRVNPNIATPELLGEVFAALGVDTAQAVSLTAAIVEWRSTENATRRSGTKASEYVAAGLRYGPPETPFTRIDDLGAVLGMTPALLARLRPHVTVWWENDPDPTFADAIVMQAMRALGDTRASTPNSNQRPLQVVSIVATARSLHGAESVRHVDAIVDAAAVRLAWRILTWDRQPN